MPSTKDIRSRIKSIKSTRQITKAMELVAAAKMRRAQLQVLATRTYARLAFELIQNLSPKTDPGLHKLLCRPLDSRSTAILLLTSNRGLIGGFNNNLINTALNYARSEKQVEFITLGRKGRDAVRKRGLIIVAEFPKKDTSLSVLDIQSVARLLIEDFISGKYDKVTLVYMDFISTLKQKPGIHELLPLVAKSLEIDQASPSTEYLFEPTPDQVLEVLLPRLLVMQIYQAVLETNASEHSARMVAMKNASDAASDLVDELTLEYNQLRQAAITKEISEIVTAQLVLEK